MFNITGWDGAGVELLWLTDMWLLLVVGADGCGAPASQVGSEERSFGPSYRRFPKANIQRFRKIKLRESRPSC